MEHRADFSSSFKKVRIVQSNYLPIKRLFDIFFSIILLIGTLPFVLLAIIAIKIETPGNVFYTQERVGLGGKIIRIRKLRSMYQDVEKKSGAMWAKEGDKRITKVGRFIRKTRIDELPQLLSVIKGDMSLIGPRPERPEFTEEFCKEYPGFEQRLRIKPGLSGYAQVNGGYDIDPGEKATLDRYYIAHLGILMDLYIFFSTIRVIVTGDGAR